LADEPKTSDEDMEEEKQEEGSYHSENVDFGIFPDSSELETDLE
jgi:hypothetical protein